MNIESLLILIVGAVQFVNILDFMMVMPLGADFSRYLSIPSSSVGWIGGSYTFAAAMSGLLGAMFVDRYDRRKVLLVSLTGLILSTLLCGFAWDFYTLIFARALAGIFGGPLSSVSVAIIADVIPAERRGKAMGKVMGAFSMASVLGVPFGLEVARRFDWRAPFFVLTAISCLVLAFAYQKLPRMIGHITSELIQKNITAPLVRILTDKLSLLSYLMLGLAMTSGFMIIPNISAHLQFNLGVERENIGILYMVGGVCSFFAMRVAGSFVDRFGVFRFSLIACALSTIAILSGYVLYASIHVPVVIVFALFMVSVSCRNISSQTLTSKIASAQDRGAFMSLQSTLVHLFTSLGAFISSLLLTSGENHTLLGMPLVGTLAIVIGLTNPFLIHVIEKQYLERKPA